MGVVSTVLVNGISGGSTFSIIPERFSKNSVCASGMFWVRKMSIGISEAGVGFVFSSCISIFEIVRSKSSFKVCL